MTESFDLTGNGFNVVFKSEAWQIACITYAEQYSKEGFNHLKKHLATDEVFVLINGNAILHTIENEQLISTELTKEKLYCVYKNTWHYLEISEDAKLVVAENSDLQPEQTERMELNAYCS